MKKSMIEVAYEIVSSSSSPLRFQDLWKKVVQEQGFTQKQIEDNISRFYSQLGIDGRFVMLEENYWDLKCRHPYEKSHIDMNEIYLAEDDEEEEKIIDSEDNDEEKDSDEYDDKFENEEDDIPFGFQSIDEDEF
ncbi:MAG: DNA-directed RNA polymerase subunit delta [Erysipelotrichaceae bacterium]|nr:DNA-directed RNA polymerase subunit delta [Erysipelotrichaceae bacterium]